MDEQLKIRADAIEEYYDVGEQIGSGQFAVVKKLHSKSTGDTFAAKFMKKKRSKALKRGMTQEQFLREADVLRSIDHKGVIYLHDIFETKLEFVLVLELLRGGELFEFLSEQDFLTEDEAVGFLKQVIEAIDYLHKKRIVHLDIKPENIVLKEEKSSQIKLIDFGLARKLSDGEMVREIMGTPEFVAPEIIAFEDVGTETDMWAIGVLTYIMLSGASPFLGDDVNETFSNISMVDYEFDDEYFKDISEPAKDFISTLLVKDKSDRMNAEECLKHEWMHDFEDQELANSCEDEFECENFSTDPPRKMSSILKKRRSTLIKTDAFKAFTARARWQKSLNKVIAISRLALLGKKNGPVQHRNASDETKKPALANNETNEKHNKDSESNKIEDFAQIEGKSMKMVAESDRDEKKVVTDINTKEHGVNIESLDENSISRDQSSKVESSNNNREGSDVSHTEAEKNFLQESSTKTKIHLEKTTTAEMPKNFDRKPDFPVCEHVQQVKPVISGRASKESYECSPDGMALKHPEVPSERVSIKSEKHSNEFDSIRPMFSSESQGISRNVSGLTERRGSGESWRHPQQLASSESSQMRLERSVQMLNSTRRSSEDKPKDKPKYNITKATAEGIDKKQSEHSAWLKNQRPFSLERNRKKPVDTTKGFKSTKDEILKWERRNSSDPTPPRSLTTRGETKRTDHPRLSLPGISKVKLKNPLDGRQFERHTIAVAQNHEKEEKTITTKKISAKKEATDLQISKLEMTTKHGKVEDDAGSKMDREFRTSNTTTRSTLTLMQGSTVHINEDEDPLEATVDKEHAFVIQANLQSLESDDSNTESPYLSLDEETDSPMEHVDQSGQKVTSACVNYKLGSNEMEGFPELSLTLQKSPTTPGDNEDGFVWLVTKEKNQRRDFLTRVLAPKVQAAKKSPSQEDVFQKRRIRHKPMGEKGPPKARSASVSSPDDTTSTAKIYVKQHSVPTGPTITHGGKHAATVQLSSNMPAVNLNIQMGEIKLADP